jgi:hypothetical protein
MIQRRHSVYTNLQFVWLYREDSKMEVSHVIYFCHLNVKLTIDLLKFGKIIRI